MSYRVPPRARPTTPALRLEILAAIAMTLTALAALVSTARAQQLPPVTVETTAPKKAKAKAVKAAPAPDAPAQFIDPRATPPGGSLTVPTTAETEAILAKVPGSVVVVPDTAYKDTTPAVTIKDVLDYVPGVFVQPKWGEDSRLSIRGSGLSRNFHLRGTHLYMDGIPISTADGFGDFQEIDPTAYSYVEVYKGANGLRFGASSLGGAINFVTPTGRDASLFSASADVGSFGFRRLQSSSGGASGPFDFFVTGSWQEQDGFRDHSWGEATRASANFGYQLSPDVETRFYLNANEVRQRIPGSVTKDAALGSPKTAAAANVIDDWQRNIDTLRIANRTAVRLAPGTIIEFGAFGVDRHLMHPIFQWLDYRYEDYGVFGRVHDERSVGGFKNRFLLGINVHNGSNDADQYVNSGGHKEALLSSSRNDARNLTTYAENAFYFLPSVAVVAGVQYLNAERELADKFLSDGNQSGRSAFSVWSPKAGLLWEVDRTWQVFANVARSAEVPSFGENSYASAAAFDAKLQTATTFEIGTRGRRPDLNWDLALYRSNIDNELQCTFPFGIANFCLVRNADKTIHQGVEIGFGAAVLKSMLVHGPSPDRLWLNLAYTYSDFRFDNDPLYGDNQLPGAPRHFLRAEVLYKHPSGLYFGPNVEWVPEAYYVDSANTLNTEPYVLWGFKAGYNPGGAFSMYLEARNLADTHYIASTGITNVADPALTNLFEPGTGRAVFAGVKYKW
jgi:iron complex outermembrane receptor protein